MKNRLLSVGALACAACMSLSAFADGWVAPTPKGTLLTGKDSVYLYNTSAGLFLANGNDWNTHASLSKTGNLMFLNDSTTAGDATLTGWTMWSITEFKGSDGADKTGRYTFMENAEHAWMDMASQGHNFFKITQNAGATTYRIKIIDADTSFGLTAADGIYANSYFGWDGKLKEDGSMDNTYVRGGVDNTAEGYENAGLDWLFITPVAYAAYTSRLSLYEQLQASEAYPGVSTDEAAAVYNDDNATPEAISAAAEALASAIANYRFEMASEDEPMDVTDFITNPTCESSTGWVGAVQDGNQKPKFFAYQGSTKTNEEKGITMSKFLENWCASSGTLPDKSMYQVIYGLPQGKYRLEADAIAVAQATPEIETVGTYLFANGGIMSRVACNTGNGVPEHYVVNFSVFADSVIIGFCTESTNANWVGVDNFKLSFLGKDNNVIKNALAATIEEAGQYVYMDGVVIYGQSTEATYNAALEEARTAYASGTDEEATTCMAQLDSLMGAVKAEIAAYERLYALYDEVSAAAIEKYDAADFPLVVAGIENKQTDWENAYYGRTYTTADVDAAYAELDTIIREGIKTTLNGPDGAGHEITALLTNPDFDTNAAGWEIASGSIAVNNQCAEFFNNTFDIYQTLTGLPQGRYTIKAQAFYRSTTTTEAFAAWQAGTEDIRFFLYGNDSEKPCKSLFDDAQPEALYPATDWTADKSTEAGFVPNCMASARIYFDKGFYENEVNCVVTDGTLKVGLRCYGNVISGNYWSLFDNIRVYYVGNSTADYEETIGDLQAQASALLDLQPQVQEAVDKINTAIENSFDALDGTPDDCVDAIAELNEAIAYANRSLTLVEAITVKADEISLNSMEVVSSYPNLQDLLDEITMKSSLEFSELLFATNDEVVELDKRLDEEFAMFVLYDHIDDATEDAPCDATILLSSPEFVDGGTGSAAGWEGATDTADHGIYEIFNKSYNMYQVIRGLVPGYYKFSLQGFYRYLGHGSDPGAKARHDSIANGKESEPILASIYATAGDLTWQKPLTSLFAGAATEPVSGEGEVNVAEILESDVPVYTPNTMKAAATYFEFGYYDTNVVEFQVPEGADSVVVGVRKDSLATNDWTAIDKAKLYYLGKTAPVAVENVWGDKTATTTVVSTRYYTVNGVQVARPVKGITLKQEVLSDGKIRISKILVK